MWPARPCIRRRCSRGSVADDVVLVRRRSARVRRLFVAVLSRFRGAAPHERVTRLRGGGCAAAGPVIAAASSSAANLGRTVEPWLTR